MIKGKNILIVCPYFYPEGGGLELYAFKTAEYLSKKNNVIVICGTRNKAKIEKDRFKIIRRSPTFFVSNTPIDFGLKKEIRSIIQEKGADLIVAHAPVPYYADIAARVAKKNNTPFVLQYHSSSLYKGNIIIDAVAFLYENIFEKRLFETSKKIISASYFPLSNKLKKYSDKTSVIPPFVDLEKFKPSGEKEKAILFVGQLDKSHKWKGLDNLLEAFSTFIKKNQAYKLIVAGDGNYKKHYEKSAEGLGIKNDVWFAGKLNQDSLINFYQSCFFVVVPSTSNAEGTPTVLFEAMASGKPIIGGKSGGIPHIIETDGCGIIANANDVEELAKKMDYLVNNKPVYDNLSRNCLKNIKNYEQRLSLEKIDSILEGAINGSGTMLK